MRNVHAGYGARAVLKGLELFVRRGEVVALLGGNGTGKSTVLKVVAGLVRPGSGEILVLGRSIANLPTHVIQRRGVGYLLQGGRVFPNLSVAENLRVPNSVTSDVRSAARPLSLVFPELEGMMDRRAGLLSGGQRQMLAVEMVLQQRAPLLLMDEPSAGLAPHLADRILAGLYEYAQRAHAAVLLVEQKARAAVQIAARAFVLSDGKATEDPASLALLVGDEEPTK
jgi:ABC-type branched-subunit amino acid transport system ATPase component